MLEKEKHNQEKNIMRPMETHAILSYCDDKEQTVLTTFKQQ
jgi:hypothetical protein